VTCGGSFEASTDLPMIAPRRAIAVVRGQRDRGRRRRLQRLRQRRGDRQPDDRDHQQDDADPEAAQDPATDRALASWRAGGCVGRAEVAIIRGGIFAVPLGFVFLAEAFALGDQPLALIGVGLAIAAGAGTVGVEGIGAHRSFQRVGQAADVRCIIVL